MGRALARSSSSCGSHCVNVVKDKAAALLLKLDDAMLLRHGGDLQDVVHLQVLAKEEGHCILEACHEVEIRHGKKTAEVVQAQVLGKGDAVHEVDDGGEHVVGALLDFNSVLVISHVGVQGSLEVLRPESNLDNLPLNTAWSYEQLNKITPYQGSMSEP